MKAKIIYLLTFIISVIGFILQVFVFEYPDGNIGMFVCMFLVSLITYSCIRLLQLSQTFKDFMKQLINILFRIS